ncbi:MAG: porin [Planctomycetota bacterium]
MKIAKLFMAGSLAGLLVAVSAQAQAVPGVRQPSAIQQTAFEYDSYVYWAPNGATESPSDKPAPAPQPAASATAANGSNSCAGWNPGCETGCGVGCEADCGNGCGGNGCGERTCRWCCCGSLADPWTLPQLNCLQCRGINIAGWLQGGMYSNAYGDPSNGPLGLNNLGDGFNLHQAWIYAEKQVDTGGCGVDWGGRIDYVFGVDGPDTQAFGDQGWDFGWNSSDRYGSAIPQAYLELGVNDWKIKAGHFYTLIGYEVVPATGNFFFSHAYTFYFGEPFTHTGVLASRALGEKVTAYGGWVDGWDGSFENQNGASMFLGGLSVSPGDKTTIAWYCTAGDFGNGQFSGSNGDLFMYSLVLTYQLTEKWTYVLQHDLGTNYNVPGVEDSEWYGINQYLLYKINDCWSFGGRFEWFRDDDGVRVAGDGLNRTIGNPGDYFELTGGINWRPHANVIIRPEVRYDWYDGPIVNEAPFDRGTKTDQFSGGFDAIFTF